MIAPELTVQYPCAARYELLGPRSGKEQFKARHRRATEAHLFKTCAKLRALREGVRRYGASTRPRRVYYSRE